MRRGHWTRADIVVKIISPSNATYDRKTKSDTYRAMGIREMWLIDTEKHEVEVRSFEAGKTATYKGGETINPYRPPDTGKRAVFLNQGFNMQRACRRMVSGFS
jgi:Uma2 family endonuclease